MKKVLFFLVMVMLMLPMAMRAQNCQAPTGLTANVHYPQWRNVTLNWNEVVDSTQATIGYGETFSTRIGVNDTADFYGVVRFEPSDLADYSGRSLTAVSFVPAELTSVCTYSILVWQGGSHPDDTTFLPGTLVVNQVITSALTNQQLNTVLLNTPVAIDPTQEMWIGIRCNTTAGYPLGAASGTPVTDKGELLFIDEEWHTLTESNLSYNWVIIGTLTDPNNILSGYNVYRDNNLLMTVPTTTFMDSLENNGVFNYDVTATYATGCESAPISTSIQMESYPCDNCLDTVFALDSSSISTTAYLPTNPYYGYSYTQQIYDSTYFGDIEGAIKCMAIQYTYSSAITRNMKIYVGNTTKTQFSSTTDWVPEADMVMVYNDVVNFDPATAVDGYIYIAFSTPFEWDGSNVVLMCLDETGSYISNAEYFGSHSAANKSLYAYRDGTSYSGALSSTSGTMYGQRNNVKFLVGEPISCRMPSHLSITNVTSEGADVNWQAMGYPSGYELVAVPEGSNIANETPIMVTDTFYQLTNLLPNTNYNLYLRAICSGSENSSWVIKDFKTECEYATTIPYVENFDGVGANMMPDCWHIISNTTYPYTSSTYHASGSNSLYFYSYSSSFSLANSVMMDLTEYTPGSLALSYKLSISSSTYGRMDVGYMTDPSDINTFVLLKSVYASDYPGTGVWMEQTVELPAAAYNAPVCMAFMAPASLSTSSSYVYLDDVVVDYLPECNAPTNLVVSDIAGTSAMVSWTAAQFGADDYTVEYAESGQDNWTSVVTTNTSLLLSGLNINTSYDVMLYTNCENGTSDTLTTSFATIDLVECVSPDTAANEITGTSASTTYLFPVDNFYNYSYTQQIYTADEIDTAHAATVITGVAFEYDYSIASSSKTDCKIYLAHRSSNTFTNTTDWTPIANATLVYEGPINCTQGWNVFDFDTYFNYNGIDNLVLIVDDNSYGYNGSSYVFNVHNNSNYRSLYYHSDSSNPDPNSPPSGTLSYYRNDVKFYTCSQTAPISCVQPNVFVDGSDEESITLTWAPGMSETSWDLEYKLQGDAQWTSEGPVTTSPYMLTNLTSNAQYQIRMRSDCGAGEYSEWVELEAYTTCPAVANLPFTEDFENATNDFPACWKRYSNNTTVTPAIVTQENNTMGGSHSLYFNCSSSSYYAYAVLPTFDDAIEMNNLMIQFYAKRSSDGYFVEMGTMTDPEDVSTFQILGTFSPAAISAWELMEMKTDNYNGSAHTLAFRMPAWYSNYMYVDDIVVDVIPNCLHVEDLHVDAATITSTSANVTWTAGGDEMAWEYVISDTLVDPDNESPIAVSETTVSFDNLQTNTQYYVFVRSDCGGDQSSWMSVEFTTACEALTSDDLPFVENFEGIAGSTSTSVAESNLPTCWDQYFGGTSSSYLGYPIVYNSSSYAASGSNSMRFYVYSSTAYGEEIAMLPLIDTVSIPLNSLMVSFDARKYSDDYSYYQFMLEVGVMQGSDISSFQTVETIQVSSASYDSYDVYLNNFTGYGNRIAIRAPQTFGTAYYNYGYVDNIEINVAPNCARPSDLHAVGTGSTSIELAWTPNGDENEWNIQYGPTGFNLDDGIMANATTNTYTVTNLSADTLYDFYVQAVCSGAETSLWRGPFTAAPGAYNMPAVGENTVTLCGGYIYDDGGVNGDYSASCNSTLTIMPETAGAVVSVSGTFEVESCCDHLYIYDGVGTTGTMLWSNGPNASGSLSGIASSTGPLTIQFTSDGSVQYGGFALAVSCATCGAPSQVAAQVNMTSATITWVEGGASTDWTLEYGPAGFTQGQGTTVNVSGTPSASLTGLTANTTYDVYVQTDCGAGDLSEWTHSSFTTAPCDEACIFTVTMNDEYGDGWNNAALVATTPSGTQSLTFDDGFNATGTVMVCPGDDVTFTWSSGEYDSECSFTITDGSGAVVYTCTDGSSLGGTVYTGNCAGSNPPVVDPCEAPTNLTATDLTVNSVVLNWNQADASVNSWTISYKKASDNTWTNVTASAHPYTLTGLEYRTDYNVKVAANCAGELSDYTAVVNFRTLGDGVEDYAIDNSISLYPNPTNGEFRIQNSESMIQRVEVYDVYGKMLNVVEVNDAQVTMNASNYASGTYFVRIYTENGMVTKRIVKR